MDSERQQELSQVVIDYPAISEEPINKFSTDEYIVRAFPGLFPYGNCDLRDNSARLVKVANSEYFKYLLRYKDGRFGKDPRFVQFMLNSRLRWQMMDTSKIFVKKQDMEQLTVAELREELDKDSAELLGK